MGYDGKVHRMRHRHINPDVSRRLARIEGHVRSVQKMVEEGRDCPEVLIQIAAVRSALDQVGRIILEDHVEGCITEAVQDGRGDEAVRQLKDALKQFI
ncbi:MAG: cytosolic protein [Candidatus Handelsmanbacteria bacterium RIFCSPLOWO2_12_FULL_64_10]|uniref:Cytosolic protein n=1 Tax=Handelsmanbacteria sp. (strain RIFCSPLOWO2_12_FULL_64_10) TaxID=1817868 RepID=A0A1F6D1M0_HANXR|nr:MAG: cytosolic protein [Candidatus Handelsmanbacteria bacterium RIFCSPLOWO2_12_FULL_64_10]